MDQPLENDAELNSPDSLSHLSICTPVPAPFTRHTQNSERSAYRIDLVHCRLLLRVEKNTARQWYASEAVEQG